MYSFQNWSKNIAFANDYNSTVYVSTGERIQSLSANGSLCSWADVVNLRRPTRFGPLLLNDGRVNKMFPFRYRSWICSVSIAVCSAGECTWPFHRLSVNGTSSVKHHQNVIPVRLHIQGIPCIVEISRALSSETFLRSFAQHL